MLWLVKRTEGAGYDEYDSFVVRAKTKKGALEVIDAFRPAGGFPPPYEITEVKTRGKDEIILGSFNAG